MTENNLDSVSHGLNREDIMGMNQYTPEGESEIFIPIQGENFKESYIMIHKNHYYGDGFLCRSLKTNRIYYCGYSSELIPIRLPKFIYSIDDYIELLHFMNNFRREMIEDIIAEIDPRGKNDWIEFKE